MNETIKLIGNTPIIKIEHTNIYVKLEKNNPGGSIKDREVYGMLKDALANERINRSHQRQYRYCIGYDGRYI